MDYRNNLDYEYALFDPRYETLKSKFKNLVQPFEYVYFFMEKASTRLISSFSYPEDYLEYLQNLTLTIPEIIPEKRAPRDSVKNWWGPLDNLELERKLNSKLTSCHLARERGWCHPQTEIVQDSGNLLRIIKESSHSAFVVKSPYFMSGRGHYWVDKARPDFELPLLNWWNKNAGMFGPMIVEPKLKILVELGSYFLRGPQGELLPPLLHCSFLSPQGVFRGGLAFQSEENLVSYLEKTFSSLVLPPLALLKEHSSQAAAEYVRMGAKNGFGIDSFIYREGEKLLSYSLLEVNYRKSMGLALHSLKEFLPPGGLVYWSILGTKPDQPFPSFAECLKKLGPLTFFPGKPCGVIPGSPLSQKMVGFYFLAQGLNELHRLMDNFEKIFPGLLPSDRP